MNVRRYREMIVRAVCAPDGQMLDLLAAQLADAERAREILRAKGYRPAATTTSAAAQLGPDAH